MPEIKSINIAALLKSLSSELTTSPTGKAVPVHFTSTEETILLPDGENNLLAVFSKLVRSIIEFIPPGNSLYLSAGIELKEEKNYCAIKIRNTGINLRMVSAIIKNSPLPVSLYDASTPHETTFEVALPLSETAIEKNNPYNISLWNYKVVANGISAHFSKLNNPVERLAETKPKEAAFLTSINNCIVKNINNEQFDANALSKEMAMSRAQLLRRLKAITGNSPGHYIKALRLQKAKELLETSALTISEVAFDTGFGSPSNFTKVFVEKFGMTPTQFRNSLPGATNEQKIATKKIV